MPVSILHEQLCKNCGNTFTGNYCNKCGQKEAHRITLAHVLHDMIHVFTHTDKGIFSFIPQLILRPGIIAREFIEGKRKIFNPFQYLIISVGVVLFLLAQTNFYDSLKRYNNQNASALPGYFQQAMASFNIFVQKYANVITFMVMPVYALFSWLFFKSKGNNYAEHFTILVFSMSQVNTINGIVLLGFIIFNTTWLGSVWISILLTIFSWCITYKQFYSLAWRRAILKAIVVYIASYCVQVLIMGLGLLIYVLILKSRSNVS